MFKIKGPRHWHTRQFEKTSNFVADSNDHDSEQHEMQEDQERAHRQSVTLNLNWVGQSRKMPEEYLSELYQIHFFLKMEGIKD